MVKLFVDEGLRKIELILNVIGDKFILDNQISFVNKIHLIN